MANSNRLIAESCDVAGEPCVRITATTEFSAAKFGTSRAFLEQILKDMLGTRKVDIQDDAILLGITSRDRNWRDYEGAIRIVICSYLGWNAVKVVHVNQ